MQSALITTCRLFVATLLIGALCVGTLSALPAAAQASAPGSSQAEDVMLEQFLAMEETLRWPDRRARLTEKDWRVYDDVVAYQLAHGEVDVQGRAMQVVILYGPLLDVRDAALDVAQIFHGAESRQVRRMAAVTLGHMRSDAGVGMLDLLAAYEEDPLVQQTAYDVIEQYHASSQSRMGTF